MFSFLARFTPASAINVIFLSKKMTEKTEISVRVKWRSPTSLTPHDAAGCLSVSTVGNARAGGGA